MMNKKGKWLATAATAAALAAAVPANAIEFKVTDQINGSFISQITTGFGLRLLDQSGDLAALPGTPGFLSDYQAGNTGDLNYKQGDLYALYLKGSHELLLSMPSEKLKFFGRTSWIADAVADDTAYAPLGNKARAQIGREIRLYDLWVSKEFSLVGRNSRLRVGQQVINWGESLFVTGGINATAAIDQQRLTLPGVPLKEVVLPSPMVSFATSPIEGVNMEAYYQYGWTPNRLVPSGTYFSAADYLGNSKTPIWYRYNPRYATANGGISALANFIGANKEVGNAATLSAVQNGYGFISNIDGTFNGGSPLLNDKKPRDDGQFGISAHYKVPGTAMDIGVYYERFHEKQPFVNYITNYYGPNVQAFQQAKNTGGFIPNAFGVDAQLIYPENHSVYGVSTNFPVWLFAIGSEISYRPRDPILVDPFSCQAIGFGGTSTSPSCQAGNFSTYRDAEKFQWITTWWRGVNPSDPDPYAWIVRSLGAQASNIQGEVDWIHYPGVHKNGEYQGMALLGGLAADYSNPGAAGSLDAAPLGRHYGSRDTVGMVAYFDMVFDGSIIPDWQVIPNVTFSVGIAGDVPNSNYNFFQGARSTAIGLNFTQDAQTWSGNLVYVTYDGGNPAIIRNTLKDRDWLGGNINFNF
jgi:hypothetical protein